MHHVSYGKVKIARQEQRLHLRIIVSGITSISYNSSSITSMGNYITTIETSSFSSITSMVLIAKLFLSQSPSQFNCVQALDIKFRQMHQSQQW
jgi:hypothetical protein